MCCFFFQLALTKYLIIIGLSDRNWQLSVSIFIFAAIMCFSYLIEIFPTFHSTSTVRSSLPPAGKIIAYSSHHLRALNHINQMHKQTGKNAKISKIIPYNEIETIRNLRINKITNQIKTSRMQNVKAKGNQQT